MKRIRLAWYDLTFAAGILLITAGIGLWSVPVAAVVFGAMLCAVGIRGAQRAQSAVPVVQDPSTLEEHGSPDRIAA